MIPAIGLVVVRGGVAESYTPRHTCVRIVDMDNLGAGEPLVQLPVGLGFEELVEEAGVEEYVVFSKEKEQS